jgi:hypothetical protein
MKQNEKERCKLNQRMCEALCLLILLPLSLLLTACALTGPNKLSGDTALAGKGGAGTQDNGGKVVMSDAGDGHSLDSNTRGSHSLESHDGAGHSLDAADGSPKDALFVTNKGNVGIGTVTPSEKLSVNGTIDSASGGIKFPDGTVQTSAAITKYQRITRWKSGGVLTFKPGQSKSVVAGCPKGTKALGGGGGFHQHNGPIAIIASHSRLKGTQWIVVFKNLGTENGSADLFSEAICATMD